LALVVWYVALMVDTLCLVHPTVGAVLCRVGRPKVCPPGGLDVSAGGGGGVALLVDTLCLVHPTVGAGLSRVGRPQVCPPVGLDVGAGGGVCGADGGHALLSPPYG